MTVPSGLPVGATAISDRSTGYELAPNSDGSLNAKTTPATGSNQRVSSQSGDFATGAIADLATLLTLAGTPSDANTVASLMGRLTKIRDLLNATLTVGGTITANAGTNLNTSALALESGGNLAALAGIVSAGRANILDYNASQIMAGKAFIAATGSITAASSNTFGAGIWHAADNTKNMIIYSCRLSNNGGSSMAYLYTPTANQALGNNMAVTNGMAGGSASSINNATYATVAAIVAGNLLETHMVPQSQSFELLPSPIYIPANTAGGLTVYDYIAISAVWSVSFRWIEF